MTDWRSIFNTDSNYTTLVRFFFWLNGAAMKSHFMPYISKLRWLRRWGLKRNTVTENVMEHSWEVATIAHALALIKTATSAVI